MSSYDSLIGLLSKYPSSDVRVSREDTRKIAVSCMDLIFDMAETLEDEDTKNAILRIESLGPEDIEQNWSGIAKIFIGLGRRGYGAEDSSKTASSLAAMVLAMMIGLHDYRDVSYVFVERAAFISIMYKDYCETGTPSYTKTKDYVAKDLLGNPIRFVSTECASNS